MAANHATNYSYNSCSCCIINYFEISSTVVCYRHSKIQHFLVWVFVGDDDGDNEMIMKTKKNGLYGPFGPILTTLAAENGKTKK